MQNEIEKAIELKPCPFCGEMPKAQYTGDIVKYEGTGECYKNESGNQCEKMEETGRKQCWEIRCGHHVWISADTQEKAIAIWNLRSQVEKGNGCEWCSGEYHTKIVTQAIRYHSSDDVTILGITTNYCPHCGRKLEVEK